MILMNVSKNRTAAIWTHSVLITMAVIPVNVTMVSADQVEVKMDALTWTNVRPFITRVLFMLYAITIMVYMNVNVLLVSLVTGSIALIWTNVHLDFINVLFTVTV